MTPSLPIELWEHIIDHLFDHRQSLSSCASVCKGWVDPARFHLFTSITLVGRLDYAERKRFLASPNIALRVRRVNIHRSDRYAQPVSLDQSTHFASALEMILPALVGLKHLSITTDAWHPYYTTSRSCIAGIFPRLTSLHITDVSSNIWQDLMRMLSTSTLLQELTTEDTPRMLPANPVVEHTWPALQNLKTDDGTLLWVPSSWQAHPTQTVTTLSLNIASEWQHGQIDRFLKTLGACLLHLTLDSFTRMDIYPSQG